MPRAAREPSGTGIYRVMLRGIGKQNIFGDDLDKKKVMQILAASKEKGGFRLYAYCLMNDHVHLLLKVGKDPLATVVKRIGSNYVYWYNTRYARGAFVPGSVQKRAGRKRRYLENGDPVHP